MNLLNNEKMLAKFEYDFEKDGGDVGTISLRPDITSLEEGMIITDIYVYVEKALASTGSGHTITLGNTDVDGFMADFASLAAADNSVVRVSEVAGALLWDDTNDHMLAYRVGSDVKLDLTVAVEAMTAGKLQVFVEFFAPKAA